MSEDPPEDVSKSEMWQRLRRLEKHVFPNRRQVLKAGGAAALVGLGAAGNAAADGLNDGDTQWGADGNRDDYVIDHMDANSVSTGEVDITEMEIVAVGPNGNLRETYHLADYADVGAAINQAYTDGATEVHLPPNQSFTYSTMPVLDVTGQQLHVPVSTTMQPDGLPAGVRVLGASACEIHGGDWDYPGSSGGSDAEEVAIELRAEGSNVEDCVIDPWNVKNFHAAIKLFGYDNGVAYNRTSWKSMVNNHIGVWLRSEDNTDGQGWVNANWYDGGYVSANYHMGNGNQADGVLAEQVGTENMVTHIFDGMSFEHLTNAFRREAQNCIGFEFKASYFENVTNRVGGSAGRNEVQFHPRSGHSNLLTDMASRYYSPLAEFVGSTVSGGQPDMAVGRRAYGGEASGFYVNVDGAQYFTLGQDGDYHAHQPGQGVRLKTPDGSAEYRIRVDNSGNVVTDQL